MTPNCDVLIIGGGFFGLYLACHLRTRFTNVVLCEKGTDFMQRASYANQARVHNGYHYPRSVLTAFRSRVNYPRFLAEFPTCVDRSFQKIYGVGRTLSHVSAEQFRLFMHRIGAPIEPASDDIRQLFDFRYIEDVFLTEECAFNAVALRNEMLRRADDLGIERRTQTKVLSVRAAGGEIVADIDTPGGQQSIRAAHVFNCTYSGINQVLAASQLPLIPLKHELAEMALVEVPDRLRHLGITIMCGPFFSCMPFPALGLHTLSHVRYTPHCYWFDAPEYRDAQEIFDEIPKRTAFPHMIRDAQRYLPALAECRYRSSLWEVKTVLPRSEVDDSRPILFRKHHGLANYHVVMGGKIDNVYDALAEIDELFATG